MHCMILSQRWPKGQFEEGRSKAVVFTFRLDEVAAGTEVPVGSSLPSSAPPHIQHFFLNDDHLGHWQPQSRTLGSGPAMVVVYRHTADYRVPEVFSLHSHFDGWTHSASQVF